MDNTKKRKIVRNFVIGYLIIQVLTIVVYLGFWSLHPEGITNVTNERMKYLNIMGQIRSVLR